MLQTTALEFSYSGTHSLRFPSLDIDKEKHSLLLGASGSGKTTWLHLLGGLRQPTQGTIQYGETELNTLAPSQRDRFRGRTIGLVFQQPHLIRALSVLENLRLAAEMADLPWDSAFAKGLLDELGVADKATRRIHQLSGGEAQRVALARALVNRPQVILADEPTASLDDVNCDRVVNLLLNTAQTHHATLIMATHDQRVKEHFSTTYTLL
ncbi:MAG TPA: ABC transporter ATP-binding protein [Cytophagales bacterium]|nr:ABC transporter ATP-binding protein [Cytophagales bacterium]